MSDFSLLIQGKKREFIPIEYFRDKLSLPGDFSVAKFEPKNWEGLGMLDSSGDALGKVRTQVLAAIPTQLSPDHLVKKADSLTQYFRLFLISENENIGLRSAEIEYAVAGFHNVVHRVVYTLLQLNFADQRSSEPLLNGFDFKELYQTWLDEGTRVSEVTHEYRHAGQIYRCQVIYYPYGRIGLRVNYKRKVFFLLDRALSCPADQFMEKMLFAVAIALQKSLLTTQSNG